MAGGPMNAILKNSVLLLCLLVVQWPLTAQEATPTMQPTPTPISQTASTAFTAIVDVESAFVRVLPSEEAEAVASVFADEHLEIVSRNLDGTWFEVRRPGRMTNLGWMFNEMLLWDFAPEYLSFNETANATIAKDGIPVTTDYAVFIIEGVALRTWPSLQNSQRILNIPPSVIVPAMKRNQDASWLYVNYLGTEGWISSFTTRQRADVMQLPQAPNLPPLETIPVIVIPPELQLEQVTRFRTWTEDKLLLAQNLENFWWSVFRGEIMPCNPPAEVANYLYGDGDVQQLPELDRYAPRSVTAVRYLRDSIGAMRQCGVVQPDDVYTARNDAINAKIIFQATLEQLDNLEEQIR